MIQQKQQQRISLLQLNYDNSRYSNHCCARTSTRHQMSRHKLTSRNCHLNHHNHAHHNRHHHHNHHHHYHYHNHDDDPHQYQQHNIHIDHIDERLRFNYCRTPRNNYTTQNESPMNEPIKMKNDQVRISATTDTSTNTTTTTTSATAITPARTKGKISTDINKKRQSLHLMRNIFIIILLNFTFSHLKNSIYHTTTTTTTTSKFMTSEPHLNVFESFPRIVQVAALATPQQASATECITDVDCDDKDKICLESKCTCRRDRPIEDKERAMCLNLAVFGEPCHMNEQCLGNSQCLDGICSCANEAVTIFNPSAKINYCHPKRRLNEQCSHDTQCPENAFCANKGGCLCQNGYGPQTVKSADGSEANECLPKICSSSSDCESEFHQCEENRCKCLATHFDPDKATCYMFGSTGGKQDDQTKLANLTKLATDQPTTNDNSFTTILRDLTSNGDRQWLLWLILIVLGILLVLAVFLLLRRHYRGYCWTKHKIGYEPNNAQNSGQSKRAARDEVGDGADNRGSLFNKNSITNKSFRRRRDDETDDYNEDDTLTSPEQTNSAKLNLVAGNNNKKKTNNKERTNNNNKQNGCDPLINQKVFVSQTNGGNGNNMIRSNSNSNGNKTTTTTTNSHNNDNHDDGVCGHVKVDMNHWKKDVDDEQDDDDDYDVARNNHKQQRQTTRDPITNGYYNQAPFHKVISPLASSTSTPV